MQGKTVHDVLKQQPIFFFTFAQRRFCLLPHGNIAQDGSEDFLPGHFRLRDCDLSWKLLAIGAQASEGAQYSHRTFGLVRLPKFADVFVVHFARALRDELIEWQPERFIIRTAK